MRSGGWRGSEGEEREYNVVLMMEKKHSVTQNLESSTVPTGALGQGFRILGFGRGKNIDRCDCYS